jgi:hypothetical protein
MVTTMPDTPSTSRAVLALLNAGHAWAAVALLEDGIRRGLPLATTLGLIRVGREAEARQMLEGWADEGARMD